MKNEIQTLNTKKVWTGWLIDHLTNVKLKTDFSLEYNNYTLIVTYNMPISTQSYRSLSLTHIPVKVSAFTKLFQNKRNNATNCISFTTK